MYRSPPSTHDPCLFTGIINVPASSLPPSTIRDPIHIGLYVDDFVFFSESSAEEKRFESLLSERIKVDFMGEAEFFLGQAFEWNRKPKVHLCCFSGGDIDAIFYNLVHTIPV